MAVEARLIAWKHVKSWVVVALAGSCLAALALSAPAHATFPGGNGKIAFHTNRDAGNFDIYTVNVNGTGATRLTTSGGEDLLPAWSPDGTKIAFVSTRDGNYEIYTMNANGTNQLRITTNAIDDVQPVWSPDGTKIAFASNRDGNGEIYAMNANGTSPVRLTTNAASEGWPSWSPDGTRIAFQSNRDGDFEIFTMNADGTNQVARTANAFTDEYPDWSPDSAQIIFDTNRDGNFELYTMNADGTSQVKRTNNPDKDVAGGFDPQNSNLLVWALDVGGDFEIFTTNTQPTFNTAADEFPDWQPIANSYARPRGATPLNVPLVPAYKQCTAPQTAHRGTLTTPSCYGPTPESTYLTVGTPDFNGEAANSAGSLRIDVFCNGVAEAPPCLTTGGDQLDGKITMNVTDVRCAGTSGSCSGGALADYTGNLRTIAQFRITDKNNGPTGTGFSANATVQDISLAFNLPCTTTAATTVGATCAITTSVDAVMGGNTVIAEQKRAIWQLVGGDSDVRVFDGGADGVAQTTGDNTLFMAAGLFFP
jgi:Tol biopolymer transport system component